jgi:hypothetical protein
MTDEEFDQMTKRLSAEIDGIKVQRKANRPDAYAVTMITLSVIVFIGCVFGILYILLT